MQAEKKLSRAGGWVVGLAEIKDNSAQLELELGLSLAISQIKQRNKFSWLAGSVSGRLEMVKINELEQKQQN